MLLRRLGRRLPLELGQIPVQRDELLAEPLPRIVNRHLRRLHLPRYHPKRYRLSFGPSPRHHRFTVVLRARPGACLLCGALPDEACDAGLHG